MLQFCPAGLQVKVDGVVQNLTMDPMVKTMGSVTVIEFLFSKAENKILYDPTVDLDSSDVEIVEENDDDNGDDNGDDGDDDTMDGDKDGAFPMSPMNVFVLLCIAVGKLLL